MTFTKFSPRQKLAMLWWKDPRFCDMEAIICDGAIRSGKTVSMTVGFILWSMATYNNQVFAICGKTIASLRRNIIIHIPLWLEGIFEIKENRGDNKLTIRHGNITNTYYMFGGHDESSYTLIQGITLAGALLDEVALMPRSFVEQTMGRCSVEGAKLWYNCNPESPTHWFYVEWVKQAKQRNVLHLHFTMRDNYSLSARTVTRYERSFNGVFYDRYILGLWVLAEGAIYGIFAEREKELYTDKPDYDFINVGLDFGGNGSAHAFCATGLKHDSSKITVLMSEKHNAAGTSPERLYQLFEQFLARVIKKYGEVDVVYADSAEQTLINGLKSRLDVPVRGSLKLPIIDRIRATNVFISQGRFFITYDCQTLVDALKDAVYDSKKHEDVRLDDGTTDIDSLDAYEYSFERYIRAYMYENLEKEG